MFIFSYGWFFKSTTKYKEFLIQILTVMHTWGFLDFFVGLYTLIFFLPSKIFIRFCILEHLISFFYFILTRYCLINFISKNTLIDSQNYLLLIALLIGLLAFYLRFLVNFAVFLVNVTKMYTPEYLSPLLILKMEGEQPSSQSSSSSSSTEIPSTRRNFLNISFNRHRHNYYYSYQKLHFWGKVGIGVGVGTFAIGSVTCIYSYQSAQAAMLQVEQARIQNEHSRIQNIEFRRQNDLEELSQGIISKETYNKRWNE